MSDYFYIFTPIRRLESMFGIAYPSLTLTDYKKARFISDIVSSRKDLNTDHVQVEVTDSEETKRKRIRKSYKFTIRDDGVSSYNSAIAVEKFIFAYKRLPFLSPPRFWNRIFYGKRPKDTFLISHLALGTVITWLQENVTYRDYQIYNKFGSDISLGFRDAEHATMFKLVFGDKEM